MSNNRILTKTGILLLILSGFLILSCNNNNVAKKEQKPITKTEPAQKKIKGSYCFKNETPYEYDGLKFADIEELFVEVNGNTITGRYNWLPAEKDQRRGTINGIIKNNIIKAKYLFTQEGEETIASIKITLKDNEAIIEPDDSTFDMTSTIVKVNCD